MSGKKVIAKANRVRGSARKARIPADVVRGMMVNDALSTLEYISKKAASDVYKLIHSARANAIHNYNLNPEKLKIDKIMVGQSTGLKRIKPKSKGMANVIRKHFNNMRVELIEVGNEDLNSENNKSVKKTKKVKEKTNSGDKSLKEVKKSKKPAKSQTVKT